MENHDILSPALQKYYSALQSLNDFGSKGNFFDDVAQLDKFFSEFRNITFVIQKGVKTEENKKSYEALRNRLLTGETLKWFVDTRNRVTKQKPFPLKKELIIDVYLPNEKFRLKNKKLLIDFDETFDGVVSIIKEMFINDLGLVEVFFSARINFSEDGSDVDLYPKIKNGIYQMNVFMNEICKRFPCDCEHCISLKQLIEPLYKNVLFKEITFVNDYALELDKEITIGDKVEMYFGDENSNYTSISNVRTSFDNPIYAETKGCLFSIFEKFISSHIVIYQLQNHNIMPVFKIVYSDNTYQTIPFVATTKSTFYRKVDEIIEKTNFDDVIAVFYCGEYYLYNLEQFSEINEKPYSERQKMAKNEMLSFTMLVKQAGEWTVSFDENMLDDMNYIVEQIHHITQIDNGEQTSFDWLNPIKEKLELLEKDS